MASQSFSLEPNDGAEHTSNAPDSGVFYTRQAILQMYDQEFLEFCSKDSLCLCLAEKMNEFLELLYPGQPRKRHERLGELNQDCS